MKGLMDLFNSEEGRFNIGLLAAAAPRATKTSLGERFQDVTTGMDAFKAQQLQMAMAGLQKKKAEMEISDLERAARDRELARQVAMRIGMPGGPVLSPPAGGAAAPSGTPGMAAPVLTAPGPLQDPAQAQQARGPVLQVPQAPAPQASPQVAPKSDMFSYFMSLAQEYQKAGLPDHAKAAFEQAEKVRPKFGNEPRVVVRDGKLVQILLADDGSVQELPYGVKPKYVERTDGQRKWFEDENAPSMTPVQMQMTPSEVDQSKRGWAAHGLAVKASERESQGTWQFNSDLGGFFNNRDPKKVVQAVAADGKPIAAGPKPTEDQSKAAGWYIQAKNAYENMLDVADPARGGNPKAMSPSKMEAMINSATFGKADGMINATRDDKRQRFAQAASSLSEALLRAATGAGINIFEAQQKVAEITPQFTDKPELVRQKLDAIPLYLEGLKVRAGPASKGAEAVVETMRPKPGAPKPAPPQSAVQQEALKILSRSVQGGG